MVRVMVMVMVRVRVRVRVIMVSDATVVRVQMYCDNLFANLSRANSSDQPLQEIAFMNMLHVIGPSSGHKKCIVY